MLALRHFVTVRALQHITVFSIRQCLPAFGEAYSSIFLQSSLPIKVECHHKIDWLAVRWIYSTGSVPGQGAARPHGGEATPLVPPATLLLAHT